MLSQASDYAHTVGEVDAGRSSYRRRVLFYATGARAEISFDCVTKPSMTLKVGTPVETTIQSVEVDRGDHVHKGQVIARLDSAVQGADVALNAARASSLTEIVAHSVQVELARVKLARAEELLTTSVVPREKVDELRAALSVAQQSLEQAELDRRILQLELTRSKALLDQRTILSPIDGVVVRRNLGPGEFARQDAYIVELAAVSPLFVEAYPPVRYFDSLKAGATGIVTSDETRGAAYKATIQVVDLVFDAGSGTFGIRLVLPNRNDALPAGLRCRVTFPVPPLPETVAAAPAGRP